METATGGHEGDALGPQAQLAMLKAVQDATEAEGWTPPTPLWHAPLLATVIAGFALVNESPDGWAIPGAIIGGVALVFGLVDQVRRRVVSPRRMKKPLRVLAFYGFLFVVAYGIVSMWIQNGLPDRSGQAALKLIGAWLVTTIVFALGITITNRMRSQWTEPLS